MKAADLSPDLRRDFLRYLAATSEERARLIGELTERNPGMGSLLMDLEADDDLRAKFEQGASEGKQGPVQLSQGPLTVQVKVSEPAAILGRELSDGLSHAGPEGGRDVGKMPTELHEELPPHVVEEECFGCGNHRVQVELATAWHKEFVADFGDVTWYFHFTTCVECGQPSVYSGVDDPSISEASLAWPKRETASEEPREQRHLAAATELLADRGRSQIAALLLDCLGITYRFIQPAWRGDDVVQETVAVLLVPPQYVDRFDTEILSEIAFALTEASFPDGILIKEATVAPCVREGDWRENVEKLLGLGPTNQAAFLPSRSEQPRADKLAFGSVGEKRVYDAWMRVQAELTQTETVAVAPNPGVRVQGHTFFPDFMITYKGRVGVIEIDGPHHRKRYASDRSRDELFRDSGIAEVYRIPVEDTESPERIREHLDRFLKRLK